MFKDKIEGDNDQEKDRKQMAETFASAQDLQIKEKLPDGGWGWVIVLSSFMVHTLTDGIIYTTGIFYVEYLAYFNSSKAETAWIASLLTSVTFIVGPFGSIIVNTFGTIKCTVIGALLAAFGLIVSAWAPNVYFLYFSVGICTGVGFGLIYIPAIVSVNNWFDKKRGIAVGIAACGAGIGTFLFSPLTEELVDLYTWKGASILLGALVLNCCVFGCLFRPVEKRVPQKNKRVIKPPTTELTSIPDVKNWNGSEEIKLKPLINEKNNYQINHGNYIANNHPRASPEDELLTNMTNSKNGLQTPNGIGYLNVRVSSMVSLQVINKKKKPRCSDFIDVELFKDTTFNIFLLSNFMGSIGFFVPFVYNKDRSLLLGLSEYQASVLLSIMGIGNMVGKIVLGFISDRPWCNRLFLFNICLIVCGASISISCFCTTYETLIAYAIVMGITSGAYASLISVILADILSMEKLTSAFGILSGLGGVACLIGPPLTGWFYDISQSYDVGFHVCGMLLALGGLTLFIPLLQDERLRKPSKKLEVNV